VRHRELPSYRGNIDDPPTTIFEHVGQNRLRHVDCAEEIRLHCFLIGGKWLSFHGSNLDDPSVIDEDIDAPKMPEGTVD